MELDCHCDWIPPKIKGLAVMLERACPQNNRRFADEGLPALRQALRRKIVEENGLEGYDVMVTAGANQAFANIVLACLGDVAWLAVSMSADTCSIMNYS